MIGILAVASRESIEQAKKDSWVVIVWATGWVVVDISRKWEL